MASPERLVGVAGTGTEVGKTWVTCAVVRALRAGGARVSARKPAQSFDPGDPVARRDGSLLAAATGESRDDVCLPGRSYPVALAPPMAADALGRPRIALADLVAELHWPQSDVGFVETAGGVRSPIAHDGDNAALLDALRPSLVLIVADAGLGTINLVRLSAAALACHPVLIVLNRFDDGDDLHRRNRAWLTRVDGFDVVTSVDAVAQHIRCGHG